VIIFVAKTNDMFAGITIINSETQPPIQACKEILAERMFKANKSLSVRQTTMLLDKVLSPKRSPGSAKCLRRGGRRPLLSKEDLCCPGEGGLS